jgi:hypothetical protein
MTAFEQADGFQSAASWAYAYRITASPDANPFPPDGAWEGVEDGLDEGVGEKILGVLRRCGLNGLLLVVTRWQEYGASSGLDVLGTALYSLVVERCKDLIHNLKQAVGMTDGERRPENAVEAPKAPPGLKNFDFGFLPPIPEPKALTKYGPNHFLADTPLNRPHSLPNLRRWRRSIVDGKRSMPSTAF